jgi:hypothetical protein
MYIIQTSFSFPFHSFDVFLLAHFYPASWVRFSWVAQKILFLRLDARNTKLRKGNLGSNIDMQDRYQMQTYV